VSACLSVTRSVTILSRAKSTEPIEISFGGVDSDGPKEPCIRSGSDPQVNGQF